MRKKTKQLIEAEEYLISSMYKLYERVGKIPTEVFVETIIPKIAKKFKVDRKVFISFIKMNEDWEEDVMEMFILDHEEFVRVMHDDDWI